MIEDNKWVSNVEAKPGGRSGTYWTVTWHDGKFDNIFNGEWLPLVEKAQAEKLCVHFKKEKPEGSKYFNIVELSLVGTELSPPTTPQVSEREQKVVKEAHQTTQSEPMTKKEWQDKDTLTRQSIEKQKAVDVASQLMIAGVVEKSGVVYRLTVSSLLAMMGYSPEDVTAAIDATKKDKKEE